MQAQWKVGELAKQTGLTVRTLQYYDDIGLLTPSYRTQSGHRLYVGGDIARLQQIVSLRELGFSLDEIRECCSSPDFSPRRVIQLHIERLKEQIETHRRLCSRLEAIAERLDSAEEISAEDLFQTIEVTRMLKYYTAEQQEELKRRAEAIGPERIRQVEQKEWPELIAEVRAEMEKGTDPASDRVQMLANRWMGLVREFTGGNPGIEKAAGQVWQQEQSLHGYETSSMREMMGYISKAIAARKG
jgi:MerR family transcriptional regulator, thiopeptide resistance regulator